MKMPKQIKRMMMKMKKRRPDKMVVCKNYGCIEPNFGVCTRCKEKIAGDAKVIDDPKMPRVSAKVSMRNQVKIL